MNIWGAIVEICLLWLLGLEVIGFSGILLLSGSELEGLLSGVPLGFFFDFGCS